MRFHTTTNLTADEIHEIGKVEVAKIEERYKRDVLAPLSYPPDDMKSFVESVQKDPKFYKTKPEDLIAHYRIECDKISKALPNFFNEFPRSKLEIVQVGIT